MNDPLYLFCFARAARVAHAQRPAPLDGPELHIHCEGDLAAVLAAVPHDEFCGAAAAERLADPAWVASRVVRHSAVVDWAMRQSPVFPARLGTLFSTVGNVGTLMCSRASVIGRVLEQVDNKAEWAVKGWLDRRVAAERQTSAFLSENPEPVHLTAGARYLRKRQIEAQGGRLLDAWLAQSAQAIFARLSTRAAAFRHGPRASSPAAGDAALVANWAFLVDVRAASAFAAQVQHVTREFAGTGLHVDLSGPWPPYSFCESLTEPSASWHG